MANAPKPKGNGRDRPAPIVDPTDPDLVAGGHERKHSTKGDARAKAKAAIEAALERSPGLEGVLADAISFVNE